MANFETQVIQSWSYSLGQNSVLYLLTGWALVYGYKITIVTDITVEQVEKIIFCCILFKVFEMYLILLSIVFKLIIHDDALIIGELVYFFHELWWGGRHEFKYISMFNFKRFEVLDSSITNNE